jgi:hypothetical protein
MITFLRTRLPGVVGRRLMQLEALVRQLPNILPSIDARDGVFGVGFAIAWYGGYHLSKPWSFVAAGIFMMFVALLFLKSPTEDE